MECSIAAIAAISAVMIAWRPAEASFIPTFAGPFLIRIERLWVCDDFKIDPEMGDLKFGRVSHFNPNRPFDLQRFAVNATLRRLPFNDSSQYEARMAVRSNNQWKENAFIFKYPSGTCSVFRRHLATVFFPVFGHVVKAKGPCSAPPGFYFIDGPLNLSFPLFPVMPYGNYRVRVYWGYPRTGWLACFTGDGFVIPKPQ